MKIICGQDKLIDALRILWIGMVTVFIKATLQDTKEEAEQKILEEAKVFERLKPYLLEKY